VWVTNAGDGTIDRINVETNEVSQTLPAGSGPTGIAFGDGALWVADSIGAALLRVDPGSAEVESVSLTGLPVGVAFTPEAVWVSFAPDNVARVDPDTASVVLSQAVGSGPTAVLSAFGSIWVANHLDGTVTRLEPSTGREEATIPVGEGPNALAAAAGSIWVANEFDDSVASIDPSTNDVIQTLPVGGAAASLASDEDGIWLAVGSSATEHRGGTMRVSSEADAPTSLDPAVVYDTEGWRILTITNDGLLGYKKVGGPEGATLVPDLASALPEVSSDGLTYRFPLRGGIKYSTGEPVRPEDFRRAIERALLLHDAGNLLSAIDGADACTRKHPASCDLSDSIVVDEEAVTFHLATPDPELPLKLAMPFAFPVPAGTPAVDQGLHPLPATGPYEVVEVGGEGIQLVRNPEFEEWSAAAQPDGFVDAISWRFDEGIAGAFEGLEDGKVDVMIDAPGPQDLATLRSTHPDQVVAWPGTSTMFVGFDVVKPPFDDARVRQALNYALDRASIVDALGGSAIQRPTCQILPPNVLGYAPYCPYTVEPQNGVWSAPDLDRAHALIEAAGAEGEQLTVAVSDEGLPSGAIEVMEYVTDVLEELGLEPELKIVHGDTAYFTSIYPPAGRLPGTPAGAPRHPHVYMSGWAADYPGPGNFIGPQFSCGAAGFGNPSGWCSSELDAQIEEALQLIETDPGAASRAWTEIEHGLVEEAAMAPVTNPVTTHAVSARVENVQVHPQWGLLLSRVWVQ
jgi:peptide/nickel transport system substrate-binding protein